MMYERLKYPGSFLPVGQVKRVVMHIWKSTIMYYTWQQITYVHNKLKT